jgi:hypothetical protein
VQRSTPILGTVILLALGLVHCKKTPEPTGSSGPSLLSSGTGEKPATPATPPSALAVGVTWVDPEGWPRDPKPRPMRTATFVVPKAAGDSEDGELAITYFGPGQGGGTRANVDRWLGQFSDRKPEEGRQADRTVNGLLQHTLEIDQGTFASGMPGGNQKPKADYALLGAIVSAPTGDYFFKLTGPKATVKASREKFYAFLDTVKPNG